jgi:HSP20 family protein
MLMRTDPFRELDRLTQQVLGTAARPAAMPMDAWRQGDNFTSAWTCPASTRTPST